MNPYPPEWDVMEEEQPIVEAEYEPPQPVPASRPSRQAPPPRTRQQRPGRQGGNGLNILSLAISVLALILAAIALFFALRPEPEPEEPPASPPVEEPVTFRFGDRVMTPLEGMPLNPYDRAGFSLDEKGRVTYEGARTGVDVSTYQKEIDWQAVAGDGIDFAILRLGYRGYTEGGLFLDQTFETNLRGALDAGLEVGVYFFSQAITPEEAEAEAAYILNAIEGYEVTGPIAFDWEPIAPGNNARTDGLDNDTLTRCAAAFCKKIEGAGYTPAVYFNQSLGYLRYDLRELTEYDLWLAEYDTKPDFYYHFDLWQYTHTGKVAGIEGDVDLDLDLR